MSLQFTPCAIPLVVGAIVLTLTSLVARQRSPHHGSSMLLLLSLNLAIYAGAYALELSSQTTADVLTALKLQYIGITLSPPFLMLLVLHYTGDTRRQIPTGYLLLFIVPLMTLVLAWTNEWHGWLWQRIRIETAGGYTQTLFGTGLWYWINVVHNLLLMMTAAALLIRTYPQVHGLYRRQIGLLLLGTCIPLVAYVAYVLLPLPVDPIPYALVVTGMLMVWAVTRYRLMDILPVVREAVLDHMTSALIVMDRNRRVLYLNIPARQMVNPSMQRHQYVGESVEMLFPYWWRDLRELAGTSGQREIEATINGRTRYFDMRFSPLMYHHERYQGELVVLREITHRIQAEQALQRSYVRLASLRRIDAELTRNLDMNYVAGFALESAMQISGADAAFIGLVIGGQIQVIHVAGAYPPSNQDKWLDTDHGITGRVLRNRRAENVPDVMRDPDYHMNIPGMRSQMSIPLLSGEQLIGVLSLEAARVDAFNDDVFETLNLMAVRLAVAIDNANVYEEREKLVVELDAFAHTVAHDLKSPLAVITAYSELALESPVMNENMDLLDILHRIRSSSYKATSIIRELLLLAGIRKEQNVLITPLQMDIVVLEAVNRLESLIEEYQAEIILPETWCSAAGYAPWVEEIWVNYISNAIKYGGKPPRVEIDWEEQPDDTARFYVIDNGEGLTEVEQEQLFQPFTRLAQADVKGHGLGLSIVRRIAEHLDGEVGVESRPGSGSKFYFTLPLHPPQSVPQTTRRNQTSG